MAKEKWLTLKEAEARSGVNYETWRRLFAARLVKGTRRGLSGKGKIFVAASEVVRIKAAYLLNA